MTAATALLGGLVIGYLIRERRRALLIWGTTWLLVLVAQTLLLATTEDDAIDWLYIPVQVAILAAGVAAVWISNAIRRRRETTRA